MMVNIHKHADFGTAWCVGVLMLLNTTIVQAGHVPCSANLITDTTLDSNMDCPGNALIMIGASSDNITLDCAGFSITTDTFPSIFVNSVKGLVIKNCNITTDAPNVHSITLGNVSNSEISNNTIATLGTLSHAIRVERSSGNLIRDNTTTTSNTNSFGILLIASSDNLIQGNSFSATGINARAINIQGQSTNNVVSGNNAFSATTFGVRIRDGADFNTLSQNSIESGSTYALSIESSSSTELIENTLKSPFGFARVRSLSIQNGGLSVDNAGNIFAVENNFGSSGGSGGAVTTLIQVDPNTGEPLSFVRLMTSSGDNLGFGFDSLEIMPDGQFLATRGGGSNSLYEIDPTSGAVSQISLDLPNDLNGNMNGLQATGTNTLLASTNAGDLLSIDLSIDFSTGTGTRIGNSGKGWTDLAMHPISRRLYTMSRRVSEPSGTNHLYEINPDGEIIGEIGDVGDAFISDIDFSPGGGVLYANDGLFVINTDNGVGTYIGGFGGDPHEPPSRNTTLTDTTLASDHGSLHYSQTIQLPDSTDWRLDRTNMLNCILEPGA